MRKIKQKHKLFFFGVLLYAVFPMAWSIRSLVMSSRVIICPYRLLTGRECLFCGLTRSFASAAHGDFREAFQYHQLWPVPALIIFMLGTLCFIDAFGKTHCLDHVKRVRNVPIWILGIVLILLTLLCL